MSSSVAVNAQILCTEQGVRASTEERLNKAHFCGDTAHLYKKHFTLSLPICKQISILFLSKSKLREAPFQIIQYYLGEGSGRFIFQCSHSITCGE